MLINISITSHELHFQIQNSSQVPRKANFKPKELFFSNYKSNGMGCFGRHRILQLYVGFPAKAKHPIVLHASAVDIPLRGLEQVTFHS